MTKSSAPYSQHLYDPIRIKLARTVLEKETRKLFLGVSEEAWRAIDKSILGWIDSPTNYHLEDDGPRDFWDSFAALMESVKLKPNFTAWITAENVAWHKNTVLVRDIQMTSPLGQIEKIPGLGVRPNLPFAELADVLAKNPKARAQQKKLIDAHSTDPAQDAYPIIAATAGNVYKVMDGNRRTLKAVIYGQDKIEAWVGEIDGAEPRNFWVPMNDMMQLVKIFKQACDTGDKQLQQSVARVLQARFDVSDVAKQAYQNRIANQTEIAQKLFEHTLL